MPGILGNAAPFSELPEVDDVNLVELNSFLVKYFRFNMTDITSKVALCASLERHGFVNKIEEYFITEQEKYNKMTEQYSNRDVRHGKIDTGERYSMRNGDPFCVVSPRFAKALANGKQNVLRITDMYFYLKLTDEKKAELKKTIKKFAEKTIIEQKNIGEPVKDPEKVNWTQTYLYAHRMTTGDFIAAFGGTVVICFDYTHKHNRPKDSKGNELVPVELDDWAANLKDKLYSTPAILYGWNNPNKTATANFNSYFKLNPTDRALNELVTDKGKLRIQGIIRQPGE